MRRPSLLLGILSFSLLAFEISLLRILSITQWYHFAYMIISIALLGFGLSGTLLSLFREYFLHHLNQSILIAALLCAIFITLSTYLMNLFSIDAYFILFRISESWRLVILYLILLIPFLSGAFVIGLALMSKPGIISRLYFCNLLGSGLGGVSALAFLYILELGMMPGVISVISLVSTFCFDKNTLKRNIIMILLVFLIVSIFGLLRPANLSFSEYKSLSYAMLLPGAKVVGEVSGPSGLYTLIESPSLRYAPGLSLSYKDEIKPQKVVFQDGDWVGPLVEKPSDFQYLEKSTFALPYTFSDYKYSLILGAGTGESVQLALMNGVQRVVAIEDRGELIELLKSSSDVFDYPEVELKIENPRTFIERVNDKFDLVTIPVAGGFALTSAGVYALFENYLLTVESIKRMLSILYDEGVLNINCFMDYPPRCAIKLLATVISAMEEEGVDNIENKLIGIRSWGTVSIAVKKRGFTESEINDVREFVERNRFDWVYYPGIKDNELNRFHTLEDQTISTALSHFLAGKGEVFHNEYIFNTRPSTDSSPYFSHFLQLKSIRELRERYDTSAVPIFEWGFVILTVTLIQLFLLSTILVLIPVIKQKELKGSSGKVGCIFLYFSGLGMGYMFTEMLLIQRFILFLGIPIFSVSTVVTSVMIFSGIGSLLSKFLILKRSVFIHFVIPGIAVFNFLIFITAAQLLSPVATLSIPLRMILVAGMIAPVSFLMGIPFPFGLSSISIKFPEGVPLAWGVNGFASVVGTTLATYVAVQFGLTLVLILSIFAYAISGVALYFLNKSEATHRRRDAF